MAMTNYYCLVAGLPDLSLEDGKLNYTVANFKSEIYPELSEKDRKLIDLFYLKFDNANLPKAMRRIRNIHLTFTNLLLLIWLCPPKSFIVRKICFLHIIMRML